MGNYVFAQYNIELLTTEKVQQRGTRQLEAAAEMIQRLPTPDVLLVNEMDDNFVQGWEKVHNATAFLENYLREPQAPTLEGVDFEAWIAPRCNTGIPSGMDIGKDGLSGEPGTDAYARDCFSYAPYAGRYAMTLYSSFPIDMDGVRTFQRFRWADLPNHRIPTNPDRDLYLTADECERFRLPAKTVVDVPIEFPDGKIHAVIAHPSPPLADGMDTLNAPRCHDEIRFLGDYVAGADYPYDDDGFEGGLYTDERFVVLGDLNAEPGDAVTDDAVARYLLDNSRVIAATPSSPGGSEYGAPYATSNLSRGPTRADYVLPSTDFTIRSSGIGWPAKAENHRAVAERASDHFPVWVAVSE
ncbi:endonuclease/exonuclease/phosphatase family protein [Haladaptatus salinisoli]|uniref:endonuclease/exonuclease/phosphatase family protein n=1 Tax=Haladaptatus salinisoli TaxID=2884876 RepID=UPI001D0B5E47|nr:endonuclease/exonuclease/phosphatase family protein [Haladaptatus salinisoli]